MSQESIDQETFEKYQNGDEKTKFEIIKKMMMKALVKNLFGTNQIVGRDEQPIVEKVQNWFVDGITTLMEVADHIEMKVKKE